MKVTVPDEHIVIDFDIKDATGTNTKGAHAYVVALCCGGLMEDPEIHYEDYQIIRADTADEARRKYNKINNCSYFYGSVMGQVE